MKNTLIKLFASAMVLSLFAGALPQAAAGVIVVPHVGNVEVMYDAAGIPIWGYGTKGRAIYAYDPDGLPIYAFSRVYSGCYVPTWDFLPGYHGPKWPRGIHRKGHGNFRPRPGVYGPPHGVKPVPGPRPGAHKPAPGGHQPGSGPRPGAQKPAPGGHGPGGPRR